MSKASGRSADRLRFSLSTNFDDELIAGVKGSPVDCLYGKLDADAIGGGRATLGLPAIGRRRVAEHVRRASEAGLGFNYLINAACTNNMEQTRRGQKEIERLLEWVVGLGVTGVTVASPYLLKRVKIFCPQLEVRVSVFAQVDRVAKARMWEDLGADTIVLDSLLVNREFKTLRAIRESVGVELELLANNSCLMSCAMSPYHMVTLAHASQSRHTSGGTFIDWCFLTCGQKRTEDSSYYLRSDWIRPEDLSRYEDLGYHRFKLVERRAPTPALLARVAAYAARRYDGNLLDLIQPFGFRENGNGSRLGKLRELARVTRTFLRPGVVNPLRLQSYARLAKLQGLLGPVDAAPVQIDNRALDGFLDGWPAAGCRQRSCADCGYCSAWADRAVRVDPEYRRRALRLYRDIHRSMEDGAMWRYVGRNGSGGRAGKSGSESLHQPASTG